jgi:hypothetical protein
MEGSAWYMKGCRGLVRKESRLQWVGYTEETGVTHQHLRGVWQFVVVKPGHLLDSNLSLTSRPLTQRQMKSKQVADSRQLGQLALT